MSKTAKPPRFVLLRYLSGALLSRVLLCGAVLVGLLEILALLEQTTPILQRHLGLHGILTYAGMRLPFLLAGALPLSLLIGALVMLTQMTLGSETAILQASGLSITRLYKHLIPATLLVGVMGVVLDDQVTPRSEQALAAWWNRTDPSPENGHSFWFHEGQEVTRVAYVADGGNMLSGLDIYSRDQNGLLQDVIHAARADYTRANGWILHDLKRVQVKENSADRLPQEDQKAWHTSLHPWDFIRLSAENPPLSSGTILGMLRGRLPSDSSPGFLQAGLLERFLRPASLLVLLLIAMPVIYIPPRTGTRSWTPVWCLGAGLLFIIVQGMLRAMGNAGLLPPPVATIPGLLIFTLGAVTVLLRNEAK
ncbi:LptF/LptG family permease [Acetobacter cibinongensis]|uniref:Transporter n=1 Tax=Acetobacter cibinongensis TaxID=146475 RepID=A0A1Z5YSP9_9PROT|nr:LptF/LptG family permease [Acetobacter cibinongensis]OUJ01226.1 transporter [Acetobacter cibinongensis]GAN60809.1 transporter YjgP/YjgQ [Acetobacter cibinongensis]GBQ12239.1 transporter YjgP/YjgQ [Acetobacter cibinongensis NRIC 0482]GEL58840.1 LPS export ABC transporter permease LptG [Acetobacter cibinongensis]